MVNWPVKADVCEISYMKCWAVKTYGRSVRTRLSSEKTLCETIKHLEMFRLEMKSFANNASSQTASANVVITN